MLLKIVPIHVYQVRLFDFILAVHTRRALAGSPLATTSRGSRGIPSLVVEITLKYRCNYRDCGEITID